MNVDQTNLAAVTQFADGSVRSLRRWLRTTRRRVRWGRVRRTAYRLWQRPWLRRASITIGVSVAVLAVAVLGLWWRLSSGPIELDVATPWLTDAISQNFGGSHKVTIGGTQIERDEHGRTSVRILDIVVRDADGTVVANAPKAEVGVSGSALLTGRVRAESLNLVGAELSVRIEPDGKVTVFAGANSRPIASTPPAALPIPKKAPAAAASAAQTVPDIAAALAWIDNLGSTGLDGHDLREVGLKNGNLTVDDQRTGKRWEFTRINVTVTRPDPGGVIFRLASENPQRPWEVSAALRPLTGGIRAVGIEARKVSLDDLLLASRLGDGAIESNVPLSASLRGEFTQDGTLIAARGQLLVESGYIKDPTNAASRFEIDHGDFRFNWDGIRHVLSVPFQIQAEGNQLTLVANAEPVAGQSGVWALAIDRGDPVIDPMIFSPSSRSGGEGYALNRMTIRARVDTVRHRVDLEQGDIGRNDTRPEYNIGVAVSGSLDLGAAEPRLGFGVAGTRMPTGLMKRLWPVFIAPNVRAWIDERLSGGTVERVLIAGNAATRILNDRFAPFPDEALSVEIETSGSSLQPVAKLPPIRDADLSIRVSGRSARVNLGRGTIEVGSGRKLNIASGVFEIPDTHIKPSPATANFRVDGTVGATALLLAMEPLRGTAGPPLDPATSRGNVAAQVTVNLSLSREDAENVTFAVTADLANFVGEKLLMGQRVEAQTLRVLANSNGYQVNGDAKINGTAATIDFRKANANTHADLRLSAVLDEAARKRLGIDFGATVTGSVPVVLVGKIAPDDKHNQINVEADLSPAKIDNLLPGWVKAQGRPGRAAFALNKDAKGTRFDDLTIEGSGASARGTVELDAAGELLAANFPTYALSEGDKVSLSATRTNDGAISVQMRGDVYDGRHFIKAALANESPNTARSKQIDLDLDIRIGTVAGHNGETVRGFDLKMSRRGGRVRAFNMRGKIGRDTPLLGDIRLRARDQHQVLYLETDDAGSLFRFTDIYPRMFGGQMWMAMDPPTREQSPQIGVLNIRQFAIRGEPGLDRVAGGGANNAGHSSIEFSELRSDFTRLPGRMLIRDGVVRGPTVGATIDGQLDSVRDEMRIRGTFVPLYGINNMFGQIPIVGLFLGGGSNEGLLGINYEAVGPPSSPRVSVNPISAVAPGLLRKLIPGPGTFDPNYTQPSR